MTTYFVPNAMFIEITAVQRENQPSKLDMESRAYPMLFEEETNTFYPASIEESETHLWKSQSQSFKVGVDMSSKQHELIKSTIRSAKVCMAVFGPKSGRKSYLDLMEDHPLLSQFIAHGMVRGRVLWNSYALEKASEPFQELPKKKVADSFIITAESVLD